MQTSKILTITTNVFLGIIVVYIGLLMLPTPSGLIWGAFNAWIWIGAPTLLLRAKNKEVAKQNQNWTKPQLTLHTPVKVAAYKVSIQQFPIL